MATDPEASWSLLEEAAGGLLGFLDLLALSFGSDHLWIKILFILID